jgi:hypothetical protein
MKLVLCSCLQIHLISSMLSPNIFLSAMFSNILSLRSSVQARDQSSHPHTITISYEVGSEYPNIV